MIYRDITGAISPEPKEGFFPVHEFKPEADPCCVVVEDRLQWADTHWIQLYKQQPKQTYSAGEWLELVGIGAGQQPTLIYLKLQLMAALKTSKKLTAMEQYIQSILAQFAADPSPRNDWPEPPYSFHETVAEVTELLSSGN